MKFIFTRSFIAENMEDVASRYHELFIILITKLFITAEILLGREDDASKLSQ